MEQVSKQETQGKVDFAVSSLKSMEAEFLPPEGQGGGNSLRSWTD